MCLDFRLYLQLIKHVKNCKCRIAKVYNGMGWNFVCFYHVYLIIYIMKYNVKKYLLFILIKTKSIRKI